MARTFEQKMEIVEKVIRKFGITDAVEIKTDEMGEKYCEISPYIIRERTEIQEDENLIGKTKYPIKVLDLLFITHEHNYPEEPDFLEETKLCEKRNPWGMGAEIVSRIAEEYAYFEMEAEMMREIEAERQIPEDLEGLGD